MKQSFFSYTSYCWLPFVYYRTTVGILLYLQKKKERNYTETKQYFMVFYNSGCTTITMSTKYFLYYQGFTIITPEKVNTYIFS